MTFAFCLEMLYTDLPFNDRLTVAKKDGINMIEFWDWRDKDLEGLKQQMKDLKIRISIIILK